jgi:hypothetical protein
MTVELHFQLDEEDAQGHRALEILAAWEQQGFAIDEILARALLALGERQAAHQTSTTVASVKDIIRQMNELLREAQALRAIPGAAPQSPAVVDSQPGPPQPSAELSQAFLTAIKKAARPGLRLDT